MVDFLIIGHRVSGCLDCVFELMIKDRCRYGYGCVTYFDGSDVGVPCYWYTSLDREEVGFLDLIDYKKDDYETIGMTGIINIDRLDRIPDYDGVMAVPVTFLRNWDRRQFQVLGKTGGGYRYKDYVKREILTDQGLWGRIFIKKI